MSDKHDNIYYKEIQARYDKYKQDKRYLIHSGIYCIKLEDQIIYIGKSRNMLFRILSHQVNTELGLREHKYDILRGIIKQGYTLSFQVLEYVPEAGISKAEGRLIRQYMPIMNYQIPKEDGIHYTVNPIAKKLTADKVIEHVRQYNKRGQ